MDVHSGSRGLNRKVSLSSCPGSYRDEPSISRAGLSPAGNLDSRGAPTCCIGNEIDTLTSLWHTQIRKKRFLSQKSGSYFKTQSQFFLQQFNLIWDLSYLDILGFFSQTSSKAEIIFEWQGLVICTTTLPLILPFAFFYSCTVTSMSITNSTRRLMILLALSTPIQSHIETHIITHIINFRSLLIGDRSRIVFSYWREKSV